MAGLSLWAGPGGWTERLINGHVRVKLEYESADGDVCPHASFSLDFSLCARVAGVSVLSTCFDQPKSADVYIVFMF